MNAVILGYADISALSAGEVLLRLDEVSPQRREKILAHKTEKGMTQSFGAGLLLKKMLMARGIFCNDFTVMESGKPTLSGGVFFNISHSGRMVICTLSDSEIGCDVEELLEIRQGALKAAFLPGERRFIGDDPERFYNLWTAKESYIKYTGGTISSIRPNSFELLPCARHFAVAGADVRIISGRINGYVYAVCQSAAAPRLDIAVENYSDKIMSNIIL